MQYTLSNGGKTAEYRTNLGMTEEEKFAAIEKVTTLENGIRVLTVLRGDKEIGTLGLSEEPNPMAMDSQLEYFIAQHDPDAVGPEEEGE